MTRGCDPCDRLPVTVTRVPPSAIQHSKASDQWPQTQSSPCKTNYVSILYHQVASTLCLCRLQLVKSSIKDWGKVLVKGATMAENEGRSLSGSCDCTDHTSRQATRSKEGVCGSTTAPWESLTQRGETHCSCEFLRVRVRCQSGSVLWHPFPSSVMLLGLYVTSACAIKLL